ncbi:MAG: DNA repair protein RecO [Nitrospinota bacterium]
MAFYNLDAIVLRRSPLTETSFVVTFFSREMGKLSALAKGARRKRNPFGASLEPASHVRAIVVGRPTAELFQLRACELAERMEGLWGELGRIEGALYTVYLLDRLLKEREAEEALFGLSLRVLRGLARGDEVEGTLALFELRLLALLGYQPPLEACPACGRPLAKGAAYLPGSGDLLCGRCARSRPGARALRPGSLEVMRAAARLPEEKLFQMRVVTPLRAELREFARRSLSARLGVTLREFALHGEGETTPPPP